MKILYIKFSSIFNLVCLLLLVNQPVFSQYNVTVAKDGSGNYTSIKAAITAAPAGSATPYTIFVKAGVYAEKDTIPATKRNIVLIGENVATTIITNSDNNVGGVGTSSSATFFVFANNFTAINFSFANPSGVNAGQAVAVRTDGDSLTFRNCRFLGFQDVLYTYGTSSRQYFKNCYIEGTVDFIFGSSIAYFDSCVLYCKSRASGGNIVAPNTPNGNTYGYVFNGGTITGPAAMANLYTLGRPWQNKPQAVFLQTNMSNVIAAAGWSANSAGSATSADCYYGEYNSTGSGGNSGSRVAWSYQLNAAQASNYTLSNILGTWSPCSNSFLPCAAVDTPMAVANFTGTQQSATNCSLAWNSCWPVDQAQFNIYRSNNGGAYTLINSSTSSSTNYNYSYSDASMPAGINKYVLQVLKGSSSFTSTDTVTISNLPTITTTGTLSAFTQYAPSASSSQAYSISGTNLIDNIIITAPANFEISSDGGNTWKNSSQSITLYQSGGSVSSTNINVRLNAASIGSYSGNITHTTTNGSTVSVALSGTTTNAPAYTATLLQQWPLDINNADSSSVRSSSLTATTPTFNRLYVSNGTTVAAVQSYSPTYGMAYCANSNGDGTWTTAVGGPGGNLNRTNYTQFTVKPQNGSNNIRLDSIILSSAFYNTSSNTKLAVVYSISNFGSDSTDITGGTGPSGALTGSANGAFATPILLGNQTGGTTNTYRLALNGSSGVTITSSQTLTIRIYNSCGSSSSGRYGMIKNLMIMGSVSGSSGGGGNNYSPTNIAFPGADGFGKYSVGGRSGTVYYVTDTTDNPSNPTVGSLRYGLTSLTGARTILFKVSGLIRLKQDIKITNGNVTIAGQSAPGDGICLANYTLRVLASNVIIRYIRSRMGDITSYIDDAMDGNGSVPVAFHDIIIDHCSMSWSIDEVGSYYDNKNFTMQWCILSESLYHSVDPKGNHGYGGIWGGQNASFHHNLLAHNSSRNPRFCGSRYTGDSTNEIVDMRNNVIYNWGNINSSYGGEGGNHNIVNNYYKPGPATPGSLSISSNSNKRNRILNYTSYYYAADAAIYPDTVWGGKFYINGNYVDGYPDVTADNWTNGVQQDGYANATALIARNKQSNPFSFGDIRTQTATDAYESVLDSAGASLPRKDTLDRRILRETRTGTASFEGAAYAAYNSTGVTHPSGIIDSQNDVGGWPVYNSFTAPVDTDNDGMPDWWERKKGLNPNSASDGNTIASDGYTMLEEYLNSIPSADAQPNFDTIYVNRTSQINSAVNFKINWTKNLYTFALLRSVDNVSFTKIASTIGNSDSISFVLSDTATPYSNTVYYKIASYKTSNTVDTAYSNTVVIDNGNTFYNKASGDISLPSSWNSKADGTGVSPVTALNNTSGNFHVQYTTTLTGTLSLLKANLYVENNSTLTIGSGGYLIIGPQNAITINAGSVFNVNGNSLTLQSSVAGTASINQLDAAGSRLLNATNVTVQRYIGGNYAWRTIAFPFTSGTNILGASGGNTSLNAYVSTPAKAYWYNEAGDGGQYGAANATPNSGWTAFTSGTGISASKGILIWGDANANTISLTASVNAGTQSIPLSKNTNGWSLIANPFPSNISWTSIAKNASNTTVLGSNTAATYRVNPLGGGAYSFSSFVPDASGIASAGIGTNGGSDVIENGASFVVHALTAGNLSVLESDKTTNLTNITSGGISLFGAGTNLPTVENGVLKLSLSSKANQFTDEVVLRWNNKATNSYDASYDAYDLGTFNAPDLCVLDTANTRYSIFTGSELADATHENRVIKLGLRSLVEGNYSITANLLKPLTGNNRIYLTDNYTHTTQEIADSLHYDFVVGNNPLSSADGRFSVYFNAEQKLSVNNDVIFRLIDTRPAKNKFAFYSNQSFDKLTWKLIDIAGRSIASGIINQVQKGTAHEVTVPVSASGMYMVQLSADGIYPQTLKCGFY